MPDSLLFSIFQYSPYHCSVHSLKDFDMTRIEVVAVVFCCFLFVMMVGGACCLFWIINSEPVMTDNRRTSQTAHSQVPFLLAILWYHITYTDLSFSFRSCTLPWMYQVSSVFILCISDACANLTFTLSSYISYFLALRTITPCQRLCHTLKRWKLWLWKWKSRLRHDC